MRSEHLDFMEALDAVGVDTRDLLGHDLTSATVEINKRLDAIGFAPLPVIGVERLPDIVARLRAWKAGR